MKKFIITLLALITIVGCSEKPDNNGKTPDYGVNVIVVNSCQYVLYINRSRGASTMVHAGNCNNPFHENLWDKYYIVDTTTRQVINGPSIFLPKTKQ